MDQGVTGDSSTGIDVRLREFVESDDAEVTSWFADAGELRFFAGRRLRWPLDSEQWRAIRLDPNVAAWTAVLGDNPTPVGHAELIIQSPSVIRLVRYAVAPDRREMGLGRAILNRLMTMTRAAGYSRMMLSVHPDNSTAIRAYRTFGFEVDPETGPDALDGADDGVPASERVVMSLRLDQ